MSCSLQSRSQAERASVLGNLYLPHFHGDNLVYDNCRSLHASILRIYSRSASVILVYARLPTYLVYSLFQLLANALYLLLPLIIVHYASFFEYCSAGYCKLLSTSVDRYRTDS